MIILCHFFLLFLLAFGNTRFHEDPHKILFGSLLEAIVATDAIYNYITESQKCVNPINSQ